MYLYHVLPRHRLEEKLQYARATGGRILLTRHSAAKDSSDGSIPEYLHLLPNLVGGIDFSSRERVAAIRISLAPEARIARLRGPRAALDLRREAERASVIHVQWEEPGLRYQEWLLVNDDAVLEWTADPQVIKCDYLAQLEDLRTGRLSSEAYFYPDIDKAAQLAMAQLIGHRLGFCHVEQPSLLLRRHREATFRLGVERVTATKSMFFVGEEFLRLAERLATDAWAQEHAFAGVVDEVPWMDLDDALTAAAMQLSGFDALLAVSKGPLEVRFFDVTRDPGDLARFAVGFRVPVDVTLPHELTRLGVESCDAEQLHIGPLWDLRDVVAAMAKGAERLRSLSYILHEFHGARSTRNRVKVAIHL